MIRVLLGVLAVWRITQFIVLDDGPFDLMINLRVKFGRYTLDNKYEPTTPIGRLMECAHCVGKWVALAVALLILFPTTIGDVVLYTAALAGAQSLIEGKRDCHAEAIRVKKLAARVRRNG